LCCSPPPRLRHPPFQSTPSIFHRAVRVFLDFKRADHMQLRHRLFPPRCAFFWFFFFFFFFSFFFCVSLFVWFWFFLCLVGVFGGFFWFGVVLVFFFCFSCFFFFLWVVFFFFFVWWCFLFFGCFGWFVLPAVPPLSADHHALTPPQDCLPSVSRLQLLRPLRRFYLPDGRVLEGELKARPLALFFFIPKTRC